MWRTTKWDFVHLVVMLIVLVLLVFDDEAGFAGVIGFCAGNQLQIIMAGLWWKHVRKLYEVDREAAMEILEMEASQCR